MLDLDRAFDRLLLVMIIAVTGLLSFGAVTWLAPRPANPAVVAARVLTVTGDASLPARLEAAVASALPAERDVWPAGLAAGLLAAAAMVLGLRLLARQRAVGAPVLPVPTRDPRFERTADQRAALVRGLVELMPQLPESLDWQARNLLTTAGVRELVPDGQVFDPHLHHVVDTEAAGHGDQVDTVARTIRPGYVDGDRIVVYPKVIVYAATDSAHPGEERQ